MAAGSRIGGPWLLLGHPVHSQIVHFPLALLSVVLPCDLVGFWSPDPFWHTAAFGALAAGLLSAAPAAVSGLADSSALPADHPAQATALRHMIAMAGAAAVYGLSLLVRIAGPSGGAWPGVPVALAATGQFVMLAGGWLGGELVFKHRLPWRPLPQRDNRPSTP